MPAASQPKAKKQKLAPEAQTEIDEKTDAALSNISFLQTKIQKVNMNQLKQEKELERTFAKQKDPMFKERQKNIADVDGFWGRAITQHDVLGGILLPEDADALTQYLTDFEVVVEDLPAGSTNISSYKFIFRFKENPYFSDKELWKQMITNEENEEELNHSGIHWKKRIGKAPTEEEEKEEKEDDDEDSKRDREEISFFEMFERSMGDEAQALYLLIEEVWADPLKYYLGTFDLPSDEEEGGEGEEGEEEEDK